MFKTPQRYLLALAAALAFVASVGRPVVRLDAQSGPSLPALHGESIAANTATGELVLFGGRSATGPLEGTWIHGRGAWSRLRTAAEEPTPRAGHAMGFDPGRQEVFLFGGMRSEPLTLLCDTWILRGREWRRVADSPCLDDRQRNAALVYDTAAKSMLLISGPAVANDAPRPLEIWRWSGRDWTLVDKTGPRRVGFGAVAYDESRAALVVPVLFGGPDAGVWEWNKGVWKHLTAEGPGTRQTFALAYDSTRGKVVLSGGQGSTRGPYYDDVWTWDGMRWDRVQLQGKAGPRAGATLVDRRDGRLTYFGGYDESGPLAALWDLRDSAWQRVP